LQKSTIVAVIMNMNTVMKKTVNLTERPVQMAIMTTILAAPSLGLRIMKIALRSMPQRPNWT
ncbi:MAG: hypothetical protein AAF361_15445, partial [Bacteroidota bacterium]